MPQRTDDLVVLVDGDDADVGTMEKLRAHRDGVLHRAVSVVLFRDERGEASVLLQRRAATKYHSGGLWSNTACTHPRPGEPPADAARRCLREEMGVERDLAPAGTVRYRAAVSGGVGGLVEHELDHLFVGTFAGDPVPAAGEVEGWRWAPAAEARAEAEAHPERFTAWFPLVLEAAMRARAAGG